MRGEGLFLEGVAMEGWLRMQKRAAASVKEGWLEEQEVSEATPGDTISPSVPGSKGFPNGRLKALKPGKSTGKTKTD